MTGRTITALRFQKRDKERVNLFLDGEYAFPLPAVEAAQLRIGQQLSEQEIEELRAIDLRSRGYNRALRFPGSAPPAANWRCGATSRRTGQRTGRRLGASQIEWIIAGLRERQYLDDREFARFWVEQRNRFRPIATESAAIRVAPEGCRR